MAKRKRDDDEAAPVECSQVRLCCIAHSEAPKLLANLRIIVARYDELATGKTRAHIQFQNEIEPARSLLGYIDGVHR